MKNLTLLLFLSVIGVSEAKAQVEYREVREIHYQMGTFLDLTIWHSNPETAVKTLRRCVLEVRRLNGIFSKYDPESSLSMLNARAGQGEIRVDEELFQLLKEATKFSRKTDGYFDATVGPLVALWSEAGQKNRAPESQLIAQTLKLVGHQNLKLYETGEAELVASGMSIDLGGIGKGYAVDRIVMILKESDVRSALINFGGSSIYGLGSPPGQDSWQVGLKGIAGEPIGILHLRDLALSTSASMGRYWNIGGKKYGHLINPKSGLPITKPRTATAVAASAIEAEALTKPLVLLGKPGMAMTKQFPRSESLLLAETGETHLSAGFASATDFQRLNDR